MVDLTDVSSQVLRPRLGFVPRLGVIPKNEEFRQFDRILDLTTLLTESPNNTMLSMQFGTPREAVSPCS